MLGSPSSRHTCRAEHPLVGSTAVLASRASAKGLMLPRSTRGRGQSLSQTGWGVAVYPQVGVYAAGLLASHCWRGVGVEEGVRLAIPVAHSWGSLLGRQQGIASVTFHSTAWSWQQLLPPLRRKQSPSAAPHRALLLRALPAHLGSAESCWRGRASPHPLPLL